MGSAPRSLVAEDFNADGRTDLAVANYGDKTFSLLLSDGMGGLAPAASFDAGAAPSGLVVADFDNDARLDVAVTNSGDATVSLLWGDGAGGLSAPANHGTGDAPVALVSGDFNRDGRLDLAVVNRDNDTVRVLLNGAAAPTIAKSFTPISVTPGQVATLAFTVANPNRVATGLTAIAFTDTLPSDLLVASPANVTNDCGGAITADAGSDLINVQDVALSFSIASTGMLNGSISQLSMTLAGATLQLNNLTLTHWMIYAGTARLTLPAALGSAVANLINVTISNDGLTLGSGGASIAEIKIGDGSKLKITDAALSLTTVGNNFKFTATARWSSPSRVVPRRAAWSSPLTRPAT